MMESTLAYAANSMQGTLHGGDTSFCGVSSDSRTLQSGELFFALQGPNFDGSEFVAMAEERQAAGAVVQKLVSTELPIIVVDDTLKALGKLARDWRKQMPARVIGITGSNGKTTLKELVASCLSLSANTLATLGNLNNEIGMPLMLLRLAPEHRYAVIEMGANHAGEIAWLTSLAEPEVVAITNAAPAHLEGFGSLEGVVRAKAEILMGTARPQFAILNADDEAYAFWLAKVTDATVLSFGFAPAADVRASDVVATKTGSTFLLHMPDCDLQIDLPLQGAHNVINACAAAAIACALDIDAEQIKKGLESVQPVGGRLQSVKSASGATLYDDSYNANPLSVAAAAAFLASQPGDTWLVLGDMAELGSESAALHTQAGSLAKQVGVKHLLATGELSRHAVDAFGSGGQWLASVDDIVDELQQSLSGDEFVLVKGSRSMGMERVVSALRESAETAGGA
jgi:UDP-N-acetylmuramoyl-tripeptide--D-alanyl-D-alanine ligase